MKVHIEEGGFMPTYAHKNDAGCDIYAPGNFIVRAGQTVTVMTGVHMEIPEGQCGWVIGRSGINKLGISVATGMIDSGYIGEIGVTITNNSGKSHAFKTGNRIAQIVFTPFIHHDFEEVDSLEETERGHGGFGSTGA